MQHVICNVSNVVDGSLSDLGESLSQPIGRGSNLHTPNNARRVTRAEILIQNLKCGEIRCPALGFEDIRLSTFDFGLFNSSKLALDSDVRQAVGTVRRKLDVEDRIAVKLFNRVDGEADHGQTLP